METLRGYACVHEVKNFVPEFKAYVDAKGLILQKIFIWDETQHFWMKISKRTFIIKKVKTLLLHIPIKKQTNSFFCVVMLAVIVKSLLVYHSEMSESFLSDTM